MNELSDCDKHLATFKQNNADDLKNAREIDDKYEINRLKAIQDK